VRPRSWVALILIGFASAGVCQLQHASLTHDRATIAEQYLLAAANQERVSRGLPPLQRNSELARAAMEHARAMAARGTISHQFEGEADLTRRGASAGVPFSLISENVGEAPNVVMIHDMWMHSDHHRSNLLDPAIDSAGISVVVREGQFYAVEDFARTVRRVGFEQQEAAIAEQVASLGRVMLTRDTELVADARRSCAMETGFAGQRRPWFIMRFTSDSLSRLPDELRTRIASGKYREAAVGACSATQQSPFAAYNFAVLLYH